LKFDFQRLMKTGSAWAIADQAVASAGNFATVLFLARGLAPVEFGIFVLINSICVSVAAFHANLIVVPMVVLAAPASAAKSRTYTTTALVLTLALLPASALAVFLSSVPLHREATGLLAVIYVLAWQLQETMRRALMSKLRYRDAIWGDVINYLGQALLVGLLILWAHGTLNEAFVIMVATSLAAAALQCWQTRLALATRTQLRAAGVAFWDLGKWLAVGSLTGLGVIPLFLWLLNWFHGTEAVAAFQAVLNVLGLANPIILSIPAILVPVTANFLLARNDHGSRSLFGLGMRYAVQIELILAPLFLVLAIWPRTALILFYGKASAYCNETSVLRIAVVACVLQIPLTVLLAVLTGAGKTKSSAVVLGAGTVASLACAPPLIYAGGVGGGMLSLIANRGTSVLLAINLLRSPSSAGGVDGANVSDRAVCTTPEANARL
jgi:O-antigen/teichoic acid export membrane protein